jgi:hypothetical protein
MNDKREIDDTGNKKAFRFALDLIAPKWWTTMKMTLLT